MEPIIRRLIRDRSDLIVVYEIEKKEFICRKYLQGLSELEERIKARVGATKSVMTGGALSRILEYLCRSGMKIINATEEETKQFYETFVDELYLKARADISWRNYIDITKNVVVGHFNLKTKMMTDELVDLIMQRPSSIGMPNNGEFFREVGFFNKLSGQFNSYEQFQEYMESDCLKSELNQKSSHNNALTVVDLIYCKDKKNYCIEIKASASKKCLSDLAGRQRRKAAHFVSRNFDIDYRMVAVKFNPKKSKVYYNHFRFDPEKKALEMTCEDTYPLQLKL